MSKKQTRRAARQAFPGGATPPARRRDTIRGDRPRQAKKKRPSSGSGGRPALRPPTLRRAVIQGAVLAVLYFIVIRFIWRQEGSSTSTYIIFPVAGFIIYTAIAYGIDKLTYERRLRKLKGQ